MKKRFLPRNFQILSLSLALSLALGLAAPAAAQDFSSFYVTPKVMSSYQKAEMNGGSEKGSVLGLGVSLGTDLSYSSSLPIRLETEYLYHGNQTFSVGNVNHDISAHTIMGNIFLDLQTDTEFTPYVGGGLGVAYLNDHVTSLAGDDTKDKRWNLAWNLGGGIAWGLSESLALDLGYRYMDLGKTDGSRLASQPTMAEADLTAHEFSLGLRISGF